MATASWVERNHARLGRKYFRQEKDPMRNRGCWPVSASGRSAIALAGGVAPADCGGGRRGLSRDGGHVGGRRPDQGRTAARAAARVGKGAV